MAIDPQLATWSDALIREGTEASAWSRLLERDSGLVARRHAALLGAGAHSVTNARISANA